MYEFSFVIQGTPDLPNRTRKGSWKATWSHANKWKGWIGMRCLGNKPAEPLQRSAIHLIRYSSVEPDPDNLAASFKPVIDGLREAGVIVNDRSENVELRFSWRKAPQNMGMIRVEVRER